MFSGKKVVLTKPQIQDADVLQSWYLNKEFRQLYDGYTGNSLEMIMEEIRNGSDISDPHATRVNFIVSTQAKRHPDRRRFHLGHRPAECHARISLGIADTSRRLGWYGIDLMIVLCDIVFLSVGFNRCYMCINDNNQLAMRTANNFGFRMEGQLRSHISPAANTSTSGCSACSKTNTKKFPSSPAGKRDGKTDSFPIIMEQHSEQIAVLFFCARNWQNVHLCRCFVRDRENGAWYNCNII